jgi:cytochrome c oxidase subunit 2
MFNNVSEYANQVDFAMTYIIGISIIMLIGVTIVMLYFVFKYSHKRNQKPIQTHGSAALETVWIVAPTIIVISMFYVGYADFDDNRILIENPDNVVKVMAKQFAWDFIYDNDVTMDTLYIPVNKTTRFDISSYDVLHSFYIPAFRIKEDAVPGRINQYGITPLQTGSFDIACAEYCGVRHWNMYTRINVLSEEEYEIWYKAQTDANKTPEEEINTEEVASEVNEEIEEVN